MSFFLPLKDRNFIGYGNEELYKLSFPQFKIFYPDSVPLDYDALYVESLTEHWSEYTNFDITAYYKFNPPQQVWSRYGVQESRDVIIYFSRFLLDKGYYDAVSNTLVPYPYPKEGCAVWIDGTLYRITDTKDIDIYGNVIDGWLTRVAFGVIIRQSSIDDRKTEVQANQASPPITSLYGD